MATSVKVTRIGTEAGGRVRVGIEVDGQTREVEFNSVAEAKNFVLSIDDDPMLALKLLLARWLRANPGGGNVAQVVGKTITLDVTATRLVETA